MSLSFTIRTQNDHVILDVSGRLCLFELELRDRINLLLDEGKRNFVINLSGVSYIDSFGLGQLVSIWTSIKSKGGEMTLAGLTHSVRKLLEITKLDTVLRISTELPSLAAAVPDDLAASA